MTTHSDLAAEQAYIDYAYDCLEAARVAASRLESMVEVGPRGGTNQARFERDVIWDTILARLRELNIGDASLVFGRIDHDHGSADGTYYIGRVAVADPHQEPVVVDWRAPVAEPFYRATGRAPMGLSRRRHFATRGRTLLGIEDELFGDAADRLGAAPDGSTDGEPVEGVAGYSSLIAALETARTGKLGDIVATIQKEQDEIIRSDLPGLLVVQGGPGTGKTVVALHRAAYLLYTHRFPLEGQGVLVVGPNRLFLGYIDQVLPSLGEAGVELVVLADLLGGPDRATIRGYDAAAAARVKGDTRMTKVLAKAIRDRRRPLRDDLRVGYGLQTLRLTVGDSARILKEARRRARHHNQARRFVESAVYEALADSGRGELDPNQVRERLRGSAEVREALEWMWPVLTPSDLLHDLFGSRALLGLASRRVLSDEERDALYRPRGSADDEVVFTHDDVPLLDEARMLLGSRGGRRRAEDDEPRTYGHIVVDEAQDLSPMQLRMLGRRSLNGSMTIVGDIAQATGAWGHANWDEILTLLPDKRAPRQTELTIGYRIPEANMELAARVLAVAAPELRPPRSIRQGGQPPGITAAPAASELGGLVASMVADELAAVGTGNVAVICPGSLVEPVAGALEAAGIPFGRANRHGLAQQVTVVPIHLAKGLELDATVVVEPAAIVDEEPQGLRALYVALTRATKRLAVAHARPLPDPLLAD